jgi:hypothetical protein
MQDCSAIIYMCGLLMSLHVDEMEGKILKKGERTSKEGRLGNWDRNKGDEFEKIK